MFACALCATRLGSRPSLMSSMILARRLSQWQSIGRCETRLCVSNWRAGDIPFNIHRAWQRRWSLSCFDNSILFVIETAAHTRFDGDVNSICFRVPSECVHVRVLCLHGTVCRIGTTLSNKFDWARTLAAGWLSNNRIVHSRFCRASRRIVACMRYGCTNMYSRIELHGCGSAPR